MFFLRFRKNAAHPWRDGLRFLDSIEIGQEGKTGREEQEKVL